MPWHVCCFTWQHLYECLLSEIQINYKLNGAICFSLWCFFNDLVVVATKLWLAAKMYFLMFTYPWQHVCINSEEAESVEEFRTFCFYPWVGIFFFTFLILYYCCDWKLKQCLLFQLAVSKRRYLSTQQWNEEKFEVWGFVLFRCWNLKTPLIWRFGSFVRWRSWNEAGS